MNGSEFERAIVSVTGWSASDVAIRLRTLRNLRMLPVGGRGRHAPNLEAEHLATILIAMAGTDRAVEAGRAVMDFAPLEAVGHDAWTGTLGKTLARILEDMDLATAVAEVRLCRSHIWAELLFRPADGRDVQVVRFFGPERRQASTDAGGKAAAAFSSTIRTGIRTEAVIGGVLLAQLAVSIAGGGAGGAVVNFEAAKSVKTLAS